MRPGIRAVTAILVCVLFGSARHIAAQAVTPLTRYTDSVLINYDLQKASCSSDYLMEQLRKDPLYLAREKKMNADILRVLTGSNVKLNGGTGVVADPYLLPVVFHIINTNPSSVTDATIIAALKDLNDAFSKSGSYAASAGADTKIRFALAQTDPDGGLTTGITRTTSFYYNNMNMNTEDARLKNLVQWDPVKYINIWIVNNIIGEISASFSCGVWTRMNAGGYATMPFSVNGSSPTDGIVVTGFGPLLAHEMGHYLGLYHTFNGGCTNNNCLTDGDMVCDTPPDGTTAASASCASPTNSCSTDTLSAYSNGFFPVDVPDQVSNFMDYGNTACSNQFTEGQSARMRAAIATQRTGLNNTLYNKPCSDNILASFTRNNADPKLNDLVSFTNTSTNTDSYQWLVDGVLVSTAVSYSNTFTATGKYKVTLKASNSANPGCVSAFSDYILVNCGVTARFWNNKLQIASKTGVLNDTILFTNNSVGADAYQWILTNSNGSGSTGITSNAAGAGINDLNYIFPQPGQFTLKLIATNTVSGCVDSTNTLLINVLDPTPNARISAYGVTCYQETKVRISFNACNSGIAPILPNMPVSFYDADPRKAGANKLDQTFLIPDTLKGSCCGKTYTQIIDVKQKGLNQLYIVVNDTGNAIPISLPNTAILESDYKDNIAFVSNFRFRVTVNPAAAILEPGDTLQLSASTKPDPTASSTFLWSSAKRLSCTTCSAPFLYADSNVTKQVIATSQYQCYDTAYVDIKVPPADDYTVTINNVSCAGTDSLLVTITLNNQFKRGVLPKKLPVALYKNDPSLAGAILLQPPFLLPDTAFVKKQGYSFKIKKIAAANLYAVANDTGSQVPVSLPNTAFTEKDYTNNVSAAYAYQPVTTTLNAAACTGDTVLGYTVTGTYTDFFTTAAGCDSIRILNLTVNKVARITINADICKGDTYFAGGRLRSVSGIYVDSAKTVKGCDSIITTNLIVHALPADFLPLDTVLCITRTLSINLPYPTVNWSDGTTGSSIAISQTGMYGARVIDKYGCKGEDSIQVNFVKCVPIQIPGAFTPNHDGKNDTFKPLIGVQTSNYKMQIWNRWGQLLFETHNYTEGWNGTYLGQLQPNGAYVYFFSFTDPDGVGVMRKGTVVLIR
ncbi:MAG: M43 family zinc metalloprotease [Bacteroidota bacterium]